MSKQFIKTRKTFYKDSKEIFKLGLTLVCYAVISCTVLGVVNYFTAPKIEENQIKKAQSAMKDVFETADEFEYVKEQNFSNENSISTIKVENFYLAKKDGNVIGGVIQVSGPTYDKGKIIVGMDVYSVVTGIRILELSDSPGFGLKANSPSFTLPNGKTFYGQFTGKSAVQGFKNGLNFDGISGATITSNSLGDLVDQGVKVISSELNNLNYLMKE